MDHSYQLRRYHHRPIKISESYQRTDIEYIWSKFDQFIPVVSHIEVNLPEKHIAPNSIGEAIKVTRKQIWKEALFVKYDKCKF